MRELKNLPQIDPRSNHMSNNKNKQWERERAKWQKKNKKWKQDTRYEDKRGKNNGKGAIVYKIRPLLIIEEQVAQKLKYYVNAVKGEISGFGRIEEDLTNDTITLKDVKIFKQKVSGGSTVLDGEQLSVFICSLIQNGENPYDWRFWWHSHFTMGAFFSKTDDDTIEELTKTGELISLCTNQKGMMVARKDVKGESDIVNVSIMPREDSAIKEECERETKKTSKSRKDNVPWIQQKR